MVENTPQPLSNPIPRGEIRAGIANLVAVEQIAVHEDTTPLSSGGSALLATEALAPLARVLKHPSQAVAGQVTAFAHPRQALSNRGSARKPSHQATARCTKAGSGFRALQVFKG
jgi:hypothetical protein